MGRVIHFEIHATNPQRVIPFYSELLGWNFKEWPGAPGGYWVITTGPDGEPGINGGLVGRRGDAPADGQAVNAFVCTASVTDVKASMEKLVALGGVVALPVMPVPGIGWLGYGKDPDGNLFGMIQNDPSATMG